MDSQTAAEIASRHGLSLADAASLRQLTDDPKEADRLAAQFANSGDPRTWLRHLFGDSEPTEPTQQPGSPVVSREGHNSTPAPAPDTENREFIRELFGYPQ